MGCVLKILTEGFLNVARLVFRRLRHGLWPDALQCCRQFVSALHAVSAASRSFERCCVLVNGCMNVVPRRMSCWAERSNSALVACALSCARISGPSYLCKQAS